MATKTETSNKVAKDPTKAKKAEKAAASAESNGHAGNGRAKKEGLRGPQTRILEALAKAGKPLTRGQIAEKAQTDLAYLTEHIGSVDDAKRLANDAKHWPSLVSLGYVRREQHEDNGRDVVYHLLTANGRKALEREKKAAASK